MTQRDGSSEHVGFLHWQLEFSLYCEPLRRESLRSADQPKRVPFRIRPESDPPPNSPLTSLTSIMSMSFTVLPIFCSAFLTDTTGPMPMISGSQALQAYSAILASGLTPYFPNADSDITTFAAPPSHIPEAFPAVTVPSFWNTEAREPRDARVDWGRGCSSASRLWGTPFLGLRETGTISPANAPAESPAA
jgi:hypothetical protein